MTYVPIETAKTALSSGPRWNSGSRDLRARLGARAFERLALWHQRATERSRLRNLSPHQLEDIGISRAEALREANKPFWRA